MVLLKSSTAYLSVSTVDGERQWQLVVKNIPMLSDGTLPDTLSLAKRVFGNVTLPVWDGDVGEFVSEMVAEPTV